MPIEISEIGVRVTVLDPTGPAGGRDNSRAANGPRQDLPPATLEHIVDLCVREVLRTLRLREAR